VRTATNCDTKRRGPVSATYRIGMDFFTAAALTAALVLVAVAAGVVSRMRAGRKRRVTVGDVVASDVNLDALGPVATVVQFSTEFCARCPGVKRALTGAVADEAGVEYTDVDLTHRPDLAAQFRVLQTPTVLVVDPAGNVAARFAGTVPLAAVRAELDALKETRDVATV
jgi:thiol-disulfide isomerase/thioredoxin